MKTRAWLGTVGLLSALLGATCGGGNNSKPITQDEFCSQKADTECQSIAMRCGTSVDSCKATRTTLCMQFSAAAAVAPRVFRPENVADCLGKTDALYKRTDPLKPSDLATVDEACKYVFQGNVKKA